jgi:D-glycero-alpha-D-manno-heptose-7-phosphate kinase
MIHSVTTMTPLRLSFAGGSTDIETFYKRHGGAVVSSAIDKFVYVTAKRHSPLFGEAYRLSYHETEHQQSLEDIRNDIIRESLRLVPVDPPLFISTAADLPAFSGLGSSSSFAVGLLYALHLMRDENVSAGQLAEEACEVEIRRLSKPIGKQDQYAAAFGGLNHITFCRDGRVHIDPLVVPQLDKLFSHSLLLWTGVQREAASVLFDVQEQMADHTDELIGMHAMADLMKGRLLERPLDLAAIGALLNAGWLAKRSLAASVTTPEIDGAYVMALEAGAYGGKIAGAGGGGFLYLLAPPERHEAITLSLGMQSVPIRHEPRGARILSQT